MIFTAPIYLGFHISDYFTIVLTPRVGYNMVSVSGSVDENTQKAYKEGLYYGSELGLLIGRTWGLNLSLGLYNGLPGVQVATGFFIGEENNPHAKPDQGLEPRSDADGRKSRKKKRERR